MSYDPHDVPPPRDGANAPPRSGLATAFPVAVAAVVVLAVGAVVAVARSGGGDDDESGGATVESTTTTLPSNVGTVAPSTTEAGTPGSAGDLPPVTIPAESSPPTTIPGSEPNSIPLDILSGEDAPEWGTLVVDLEEGGYQDFAVHLREEQRLQLLSLGDDGIRTQIQVFAPDGSSEGGWEGGEPGVINGLEWFPPDDRLPATGTYVIRVVHQGGSHETFALGFFGDP